MTAALRSRDPGDFRVISRLSVIKFRVFFTDTDMDTVNLKNFISMDIILQYNHEPLNPIILNYNFHAP